MGTYNISAGAQTTVSEVYRVIANALGVSSPPRYAVVRTGEVHAIALDSKEAREEWGGNPRSNSQTASSEPSIGYAPNVNRYRPPSSMRSTRRRCTPGSTPRLTARSRRRVWVL